MKFNTKIYCLFFQTVAITATSMMGMQQEEQKTKQLTLLCFLPRELYKDIGRYVPPFTIEERILNPEESAQYNLPFKYERIDKNTNPSLWERFSPTASTYGDNIHYVNSATRHTDNIYSMDESIYKDSSIYRCVGPCAIDGKNVCIVNDDFCNDHCISIEQSSWFSETKKTDRWGRTTCLAHDVNKKFHPGLGYFVDADNSTETLYATETDGTIIARRYHKKTGMLEQKLIQPSLSEAIQKQLYPLTGDEGVFTRRTKYLALQFDHTQPEILFACRIANINSYAVLHRPTGYIERITSNTTPLSFYDAKKANPLPLLDSQSSGRLRVLGRDVGIKLVTVHPTMQPSALYVMGSVVHAAEQFCKNLETGKENRCTVDGAQLIIDTLMSEVPKFRGLYGRLHFIWQSQMADGSYAVTKVYRWLEQQKLQKSIAKITMLAQIPS